MAKESNSIKELEHVSIHAWLFANGIKTESGKPLDFKSHRYLFDIYADDSKYLCCIKAGQIGFSTMAILKTLWLAKYKKIDCGYILPTVDMVQKFVGSKVNRIAQQNPVIEHLFKDKDSISQKQIGESYIHYLGAMTDRSAIMLSLDMLVADEYDKSPQDILEIYDSRLQHSSHGYKWIFSNPTKPDWGVDNFYQVSDQKKWNITHSCGKTYVMDESCIDYQTEKYRCPKCKDEITDEERRMGEWYSKDGIKWTGEVKGYAWSGWWIPLWIVPQVTASVIAEHKRSKSPEYFYNFVAGLPYLNTNDALSQQLLEANLTGRVNDQTGRIIIGVDTGHNIHYVLGNRQGIFYHGYINSVAENEALPVPLPNYDPYNELDKLMVRFSTAIMIADQGGDLIGIRKLQAKYKGRVFLCWFTKETKTQQIIRWGEGEEFGRVMVDRNRAVQIVVDEIKERKLPIFGDIFEWQPYFDHWLNMYRVREMKGEEGDPQYNWRWVWKRKGDDHLCFVAGTKILTVEGDKKIEEIKLGDRVLTRNGYKKVIATMDRETEVIDTGLLQGTPDHPVYTKQDSFKPLQSIVYNDIITVWHQNKLYTKALHFADTQIQKCEQKEFTLYQMELSKQKELGDFMRKFTKIILGKYRKIFVFITKTTIHLITNRVTWGYYHEQNTKDNTIKNGLKTQNTVLRIKNICIGFFRMLIRNWQNGQRLIRENNLCQSTQRHQSYYKFLNYLSVFTVGETEVQHQDKAENSVRSNVQESSSLGNGNGSIQGIIKDTTKRVYNFEVEDEHEYFANGILVHNCLSTIYMRVGLDRFGQDLAEIIRNDDWLDTMPIADKPFRIPSKYRAVEL